MKLSNGEICFNNTYFSAKTKACHLLDPKLSVEIIEDEKGLKVEITTTNPAFFIHLEYAGKGRFEDSSFTLLTGEKRSVRYLGETNLESLKSRLSVYDLYHSYA